MDRIKSIKEHFKKNDPIIYSVLCGMDLVILPQIKEPYSYFQKLCREIIGQQLSNKSSDAILNRFYNLFPDKIVNPEILLNLSEQELRNVGMSWAKARYIKDLAFQTMNKTVNFSKLHLLKDEVVIKELTKVKGIGNWTAEMFLIFTLGREDIFSLGDLSLRRAIQKLYKFKKEPNENQIIKVVQKWSPFKSYGCLALWESVDRA